MTKRVETIARPNDERRKDRRTCVPNDTPSTLAIGHMVPVCPVWDLRLS